MNSFKQRLEGRTQKVIDALDHLSKLGERSDEIRQEWIDSIDGALRGKLQETISQLANGFEDKTFRLNTESAE